jgi:uncharacterized protein
MEAMADTPVVVLVGPRQAGKTTLVREIAGAENTPYVTLDDPLARLAAQNDPVGLIRSYDRVVVDEVQRVPELYLSIKKAVDDDRRPGRFLLTGSANLMAIPQAADSLAGRMEMLQLLPLSQSEIRGAGGQWLDAVFSGTTPTSPEKVTSNDLVVRVLAGGYPEARSRSSARRRTAWFRQYVEAIIQRDVTEISDIAKPTALRTLLSALGHTAGQLSNYSEIGGTIGLDHKTVSRYMSLLDTMFLIRLVPPYFNNHLKRLIKTPKVQFLDSGVLAAVIGCTEERIATDRRLFGPLLETFVYSELLKLATVSDGEYSIMHYRDRDQVEVDFVIERADGTVVAVEVKASATIREHDLRGLRRLAAGLGDTLKQGLILYDGSETVPLDDRLIAAPVSSLWA